MPPNDDVLLVSLLESAGIEWYTSIEGRILFAVVVSAQYKTESFVLLQIARNN